jgi:hypothetical protein
MKSRRPIKKRHFSAVRKNPRLVARINARYLPGGLNRDKVRHRPGAWSFGITFVPKEAIGSSFTHLDGLASPGYIHSVQRLDGPGTGLVPVERLQFSLVVS